MALNLTVSKKIWFPIIIAACGFLALVMYSRNLIETAMMEDRIEKVRSVSESAVTIVGHYEQEAAAGRLTTEEAQAQAKAALRGLRYDGKNGYIYIYNMAGVNVMLPPKPSLEGKNLIDLKDPSGFMLIRDFISQIKKQGYSITHYGWSKPGSDAPEPKVGYTIGFKPWGWMVGTGIYVDDVKAEIAAVTYNLFMVCGVFLILIVVPSAWLAQAIAKPIRQMTDSMKQLASGDVAVDVGHQTRTDEIGAMAQAVNVFKENAIQRIQLETEAEAREKAEAEAHRQLMLKLADDFEDAVGDVLQSTSSTAQNLTALSRTMSENAVRTTEEANIVREASDMASRNVETVAAASEELTASIAEIASQVQEASTNARETAADAETANTRVGILSDAASRIGEVISLINDIASQTNLLALNATIEAARAGDAGKGFAVVANEVKTLANQTAKATQDITEQINQIQDETGQVVTAIATVSQRIVGIDNVTASIASAIEEQTAATQEISRSVQEAADGTRTVSESITTVVETASEAQNASSDLSDECQNLLGQTNDLKVAVDNILSVIREDA